jgi:hypothetical protein
MSDCFASILKYLDPIISKNVLGLRNVGLKVFSSLIQHCRKTKVVDEEIKKTRKGLINISMDYVTGLIKLYIDDPDDPNNESNDKAMMDMGATAGEIAKPKFYRNED